MTQLCLRCGRHEYAGAFCSFCRTAPYSLADHECSASLACPLGPHLDLVPGPWHAPAIKWSKLGEK